MIKKEVPAGVNLVSLLFYVGAAIFGIFGIFVVLGVSFLFARIFGGIFGAASIFIYFIFVIMGVVVNFLVGRGLRKGEKWARVLAIVLSCLVLIDSLKRVFAGHYWDIILVAISCAVIIYLSFNKEVKKAFG